MAFNLIRINTHDANISGAKYLSPQAVLVYLIAHCKSIH